MVISKMNFPIIILYITIPVTICFIIYFFFKLVEKLVSSLIYYKTYNYNFSLKNRINNLKRIIFFIMWTQTITLTSGAVDNAPQKTRDQACENIPQWLLAGCSLAEPSLAEPSLVELSLAELNLAELSLTQLTGYDWWD